MNAASEPPPLHLQWAEKAEHDLINAEHTLALGEDCPFDTVCFHAQQCAEKYLKALLCYRDIDFPRTHDIRILVQAALAVVPLGIDAQAVVSLNRYAVETRYPGDWEPFDRSEAIQAVKIARTVRQVVRALLPQT